MRQQRQWERELAAGIMAGEQAMVGERIRQLGAVVHSQGAGDLVRRQVEAATAIANTVKAVSAAMAGVVRAEVVAWPMGVPTVRRQRQVKVLGVGEVTEICRAEIEAAAARQNYRYRVEARSA